jgi:hypothetical protein
MELATWKNLKTNMKAMGITVVKGIISFRRIFLTYFTVLSISGLVYAVFSVYPNINPVLEDSRSTPWGIVTSIFALFAYQIFLNPAIFLSVGQGVNIIAHGVSFLLCFLVSFAWYRLFGKVSILD